MNESSANISENWHGFIKLALSEVSYSSQVIFSIALFVIFVASLVGNTLTCIVIYYDKTMHTATNCYLFNLAVSDLLVTLPILIIIYQLLTQKNELVQLTDDGVWSCNFVLCIHFLFITILWNNGILIMTALSIERYIAVCYPMMLKGTPVWRRVGKIILIIWTLAIVETVPEFWLLEVFDTGNTLICFSFPSTFGRIVSGVSALVTFVIPLVIMIFVYTKIAFKVNDSNGKYELKDAVSYNGFKRKRVNKLIALTVSFVVCWLPFFLIRLLVFSIDLEEYSHLHQWWSPVHKVAMFNSWFTTILNPLLFSVMSTKFRKSLKKLWEGKLMKRSHRNEKSEIQQTQSQHNLIEVNKH